MLTAAAPALALGVALALNGLVLGVETAFPVAVADVGAGGLVALVTIALRGSIPPASSVERVTFPVFAACLLLLPFMPGTGAFQAVMALLVADLSAYLVFHWNVLVLLAYRKLGINSQRYSSHPRHPERSEGSPHPQGADCPDVDCPRLRRGDPSPSAQDDGGCEL